jgi:hypothetical protein
MNRPQRGAHAVGFSGERVGPFQFREQPTALDASEQRVRYFELRIDVGTGREPLIRGEGGHRLPVRI